VLFNHVCQWCRELLVPVRTRPWIVLLSFGLLRTYCCPHCGDSYLGFVRRQKSEE
jgi:hypothetical protein